MEDKIEKTEKKAESRFNALRLLENNVEECKRTVDRCLDSSLELRKKNGDAINEMRQEHSKSLLTVEAVETKMQQILTDTKYWL